MAENELSQEELADAVIPEETDLSPETTEPQPPTEATGEAGEEGAAEKPTDEPPAIGEDEKLKAEIAELEAKKKTAKDEADYWTAEKRRMRDKTFMDKEAAKKTKPAEAEGTAALNEPKEEDFETFDEYTDAKADFKIAKGIADYEAKQEQKAGQAEIQTFTGRLITDGQAKYEDFEDVAMAINVPITVDMIDILRDCENPVEVAYHLGNNVNVCASISRMTRDAQVRELTKIDLAAGSSAGPAPKSKTVTSAPAPISPTRGENVVTKDPENMPQAEFEQWWKDQGYK